LFFHPPLLHSIKEHIDFKQGISKSEYLEPVCNFDVPVESEVDQLPGVQFRNELSYYPESGLKEVLCTLSIFHHSAFLIIISVTGNRVVVYRKYK